MPYVKGTVHFSRIAGTALKTFTHGSVQTVVAAGQTNLSHYSQNTASLADSLVGRFRKAEKNKSNKLQSREDARQASTSSAAARPETSYGDGALDKYFDAWQKHQRNGGNDWQQFQFARRIEWQPPNTVPGKNQEAALIGEVQENDLVEELVAPKLKRSYTTSALDNFGQALDHDATAEAVAREQLNNALAEEVQRAKEDAQDVPILRSHSATDSPQETTTSFTTTVESVHSSTPNFTPNSSFSTVASESIAYEQELLRLAEHKHYHEIPTTFQALLRTGEQTPSPASFGILLTACIEITHGKHQKVSKALEIYSDMLRRKVVPDAATFGCLIQLLATRAMQAVTMRQGLEERLRRYGGLEESGKFMFSSSQSEHAMTLQDSSLSIALKMFDRAISLGQTHLPTGACATLLNACAEQDRLEDMVRIRRHIELGAAESETSVFPSMIKAFGRDGNLYDAVATYDDYKDLAVANNSGENGIIRIDNEVYAALIRAYGTADRLKGGLKFLASIQSTISDNVELERLREVVALEALLPLALRDETCRDAFDLTESLNGRALSSALATVCTTAADKNNSDSALKAFNTLADITHELANPATAMLAMHVRNANVEAAEPYWQVIDSAPASIAFIEPSTMRTIALIGVGQAERGLRQSRHMFSRIRDAQAGDRKVEAIEQIDEAIELLGDFVLKAQPSILPAISIELLNMMLENGGLVAPTAEHLVARIGPEQIACMTDLDIQVMIQVQGGMILDGAAADIAGAARFAHLLESAMSRSAALSNEVQSLIDRVLVSIDRPELSRMWKSFRYSAASMAFAGPSFAPPVSFPPPALTPFFAPQLTHDESFDPYAARTDVKGSNAINELLERPQGRRMAEALTKFKNIRRVGRVPRMFTYGKLIESASKENNMNLAHDILEMAKQDVPFDARYRVVRFGWQQILDHVIAGCLTLGRRELAAKHHQDLTDMGAAPSANTFGLYITTLKENTKTFDEASEAVKIFLRAKGEGVEPTSFLYNALIGKLGKARRIDDCLFYFAEMRNLGIRPTSVTYGTIVNALCRVSDEKFAEEIFEEMETCTNYKPRPAPYHSLMQFFLTTKRDKSKVLAYYDRMRSKGIEPTIHTYKLLIDAHATLDPVNIADAEAVLEQMKSAGVQPEAVHYASLIHAKGCVLHDTAGARALFDSVLSAGAVRPQPCMYQALFESFNANHVVAQGEPLLADMRARGVEFTPYIANALIHGWTLEKNLDKAWQAFERVPASRREPSTYEAMVRACLAAEQRDSAKGVVREALGRGYPGAVAGKIAELVR